MEIELPNKPFLTNDSQLQEIVLKITDIISVDRIYFFHFEYKEINFLELIILIPNSAKQHIIEAKPLAKIVLSRYPNFRFRMLYAHEVRDTLKQGSITFFNICRPKNLIYRLKEGAIDSIIDELNHKAVQKHAIRKFKKELKKIVDFREGFEFYLARKNYPLAALMLHQSIELSYRAAEIMIVGKERASHCIRNHQKYLAHYAPEFNRVFNEQEEEEMILVDLLNGAYLEVRYENAYQITADQLDYFTKKADTLEILVKELYEVVIENFRKSFQENENINNLELNEGETITKEDLRSTLLSIEKMIKNLLQ